VNILLRRLMIAFLVLAEMFLLSGCVVHGGYYDEDIGGAYYEPYGGYYGGWGAGYYVAPFREGEHHHSEEHRPHSEGGHAARAYKPAPASHSMPSIPSRSRSGGSRSR